MRVLLIAGRYLPHTGGLETVVWALAQQLQAQGHDVRVLTHRYPRTLPLHEVLDGVRVTRQMLLVPRIRMWPRPLTLLAALLLFVPNLVALAWHVRSVDAVGLHYVGVYSLFVWLLHVLRPFPLVVSLHGGDVDDLPHHDRLQRTLLRQLAARAHTVTACSAALLAEATTLAPTLARNGVVLHNGVDVAAYDQALPRQHSRPYIAAVGRLHSFKGFDRLIRVLRLLPHTDVDLLIAGDGPERATLEALIRQCGLGDRVHLLGTLPAPDVASLLKGARLVAMPSLREPFGIVALEAMAAGKRLIATPVGGLPEFAATVDNILAPPDDAAWAGGLITLLGQGVPGGVSEVNRARAAEQNWAQVAGRYRALLVGALADHHRDGVS